LFGSFKRSDGIGGNIKGFNKAAPIEKPLRMPIGDFALEKVDANQVY
jgi:hypothetical protein